MEGGVVSPEGLFFSGLFRGAEAGAGSNTSSPGRLAPRPCHFVCFPPNSQKSLPATDMTGHSEPLGPALM